MLLIYFYCVQTYSGKLIISQALGGIYFVSFCDFSIGYWNCSNSVVFFFVFHFISNAYIC